MTLPNNFSGEPTGDRRHSLASTEIDIRHAKYGLPNPYECSNGREGLVTAGPNGRINVPLPRVSVNALLTRNGVGRRAGVDPASDRRAYTVGPTCRPQRATARKAPAPQQTREVDPYRVPENPRGTAGVRAGPWRAADTPRPSASGNAARGELCVLRPPNRRDRPRPCTDSLPSSLCRGGVHHHQPAHRAGEPNVTDTAPGHHPNIVQNVLRTLNPNEAAQAGRWYSRQGDWRTAAVLHQLAAALEHADRFRPSADLEQRQAVAVPLLRPPMRDERPRTDPHERLAEIKAQIPNVPGSIHQPRKPADGDERHPEPCGYPDMLPCICRPGNGEPSPAPMPDQLAGAADCRRPVDPATTASIPLPESHAPTTCVALVAGGGAPYACGELIVWRAGGWVHASDDQLGPCPHPATPQGPGPLPQRKAP